MKWEGYRCFCVCGCRTSDDEEKVSNTGCVACSDASHKMELEPYVFVEKPVAKSSTSVCLATVCPKCGHKFDGKIGGAGEPCKCKCHEGRI